MLCIKANACFIMGVSIIYYNFGVWGRNRLTIYVPSLLIQAKRVQGRYQWARVEGDADVTHESWSEKIEGITKVVNRPLWQTLARTCLSDTGGVGFRPGMDPESPGLCQKGWTPSQCICWKRGWLGEDATYSVFELVYTGNQNQDNYKLHTIRYEVQPHFAVCTHPDSEVTKQNKLCNASMNRLTEFLVTCFSHLVEFLVIYFSHLTEFLVICFSHLFEFLVICFSHLAEFLVICFSHLIEFLVICFSHLIEFLVICFSHLGDGF